MKPDLTATPANPRRFRFEHRQPGEAYALRSGADVSVTANGAFDEAYTAGTLEGSDAIMDIKDPRLTAALRGDRDQFGEHWSSSQEGDQALFRMAQPEKQEGTILYESEYGKFLRETKKTRQTLSIQGGQFSLETPTTAPWVPYLSHTISGSFDPVTGAIETESLKESLQTRHPHLRTRNRVTDLDTNKKWLMTGVDYFE